MTYIKIGSFATKFLFVNIRNFFIQMLERIINTTKVIGELSLPKILSVRQNLIHSISTNF